jgi:hypothetical protein
MLAIHSTPQVGPCGQCVNSRIKRLYSAVVIEKLNGEICTHKQKENNLDNTENKTHEKVSHKRRMIARKSDVPNFVIAFSHAKNSIKGE